MVLEIAIKGEFDNIENYEILFNHCLICARLAQSRMYQYFSLQQYENVGTEFKSEYYSKFETFVASHTFYNNQQDIKV